MSCPLRCSTLIKPITNFRALNRLPRYDGIYDFTKIDNVRQKVNKYLQGNTNIKSTINGYPCASKSSFDIYSPLFSHKKIGTCFLTDENELDYLNQSNVNTKCNLDSDTRINIMAKISNLIEKKYYDDIIASIIVNQGKNLFEAELDLLELIDFVNFNIEYFYNLQNKQPLSTENTRNISRYLPLNGFVSSITPFNFNAIAGNLALTPILMNNMVSWKPSMNSLLSNHLLYKIFLEAGVPAYMLDFTIIEPEKYSDKVLNSKNLAGLAFTGSTKVFSEIYKKVGNNIDYYKNYPRLVGETGGKNYHFVFRSNKMDYNFDDVVQKTFESAFNYSGQKCSACSRLYLPIELVDDFISIITPKINSINKEQYGLISKESYQKTVETLDNLKSDNEIEILYGGNHDDIESYYIEPTVLMCENPNHYVFSKEFFAPILAIYPYKGKFDAIEQCKKQNYYALTGSIFIDDYSDHKLLEMIYTFQNTCGNMYINNKSTGAVVGQQPFGGFNKSGTNDKAGDMNLLLRFTNQVNIKM